MDDRQKDFPETEPEKEPYVPASLRKRIYAWIGLAYMIIIVLLNFYALMTGKWLSGIAPLMLCPAVAGLAAVSIHNYRTGAGRRSLPTTLFVVALCAVSLAGSLYLGIPALIRGLGVGR